MGRYRILSGIVREVSEVVEIVHVRYVHWCQKVSVCTDQSGMRSEFFCRSAVSYGVIIFIVQ